MLLVMFCQIIIQTFLLIGFHWYTPKELEIKWTTQRASSVPFLEMFLKSDIDDDLSARFNDKALNILHLDSTIPIAGVYISQLLRHAQACGLY
jgi:hypothetical protein